MHQVEIGPPGPSLGGDAIIVANLPTGQLGGGDDDDGFGFDDFEIDNDDLPGQEPSQELMPPPPPPNTLASPVSPGEVSAAQPPSLQPDAAQMSPPEGTEPSQFENENRTPLQDTAAGATQTLPTAAVPCAPEKRCTDKHAGLSDNTPMASAPIPFPETEEQEHQQLFDEQNPQEDIQASQLDAEGEEDEESPVRLQISSTNRDTTNGTNAQLEDTHPAAPVPVCGNLNSPEPGATGTQPSPGEQDQDHVSPTPEEVMETEHTAHAPEVQETAVLQQPSAAPTAAPPVPAASVPLISVSVSNAASAFLISSQVVQPVHARPLVEQQTTGPSEQQTGAATEPPLLRPLPFSKSWNSTAASHHSTKQPGVKSRLGLASAVSTAQTLAPPSAVAAETAIPQQHQNGGTGAHTATPSTAASAAGGGGTANGSTPLTTNLAAKLMAAAPTAAATTTTTTPAPVTPAFGPGAGAAAPTTGPGTIRAPPPSPAGPEIQYDDPLLQFECLGREVHGVLSSLVDDEAQTAAVLQVPIADNAVLLGNSTKELDAQAQRLLQELETMEVDMRVLRVNYALDAAEAVAAVQVAAAQAAAAMGALSAAVEMEEGEGGSGELEPSAMEVGV